MKVIRNIVCLSITLLLFFIGCAEDPKMPDNLIGATKPTLVFLTDSLNNNHIMATRTTVYGKIESANGAEVIEKGFIWYKEGETVQSTSSAVTDGSDGVFYMTLEDLQDSAEYFVLAYARNTMGESRTEAEAFKTIAGLARVKTVNEPGRLQATRATIKGEILSSGDGPILEMGIGYRKTTSQTYTNVPATHTSGNTFESEITGLTAETEYYVRAYIRNNFGTATGSDVKITTTTGRPVIHTLKQEELTETYATYSANVADEGDATVTSRGFIYGKSKEELGGPESVTVTVGQGIGSFSQQLTDLLPQQLYYITAFAENTYGVVHSDTLSFVLLSNSPTVMTNSITVPESGSLLFKGTRIDWGINSSAYRVGFVYSTTSSSPALGSGIEVLADDLTRENFEKKVSGLRPNTVYYMRAYATNSSGYTSYGEVISLRTPDIFTQEAVYPGPYLVGQSAAYVSVYRSSATPGERMFGYLMGGSTGVVPSNDFWEFNAANQSWRKAGALPAKRSFASAAYNETIIAFFGGLGEDNQPKNDLYLYGDGWQIANNQTNKPSPRYAATSSFLSGSMYIVGGVKQVDGVRSITDEVRRLWIFSTTWYPEPTFPEPQYHSLSFSIGGYLYAGLGQTSLEDTELHSNRFFSISDGAEHWTELPAMPGGRALGGTVRGTEIYVVDDQGYIHIFNTQERQWRTVTRRLPVQNRKVHCVYGFAGSPKVYIGLGEDSRDVISYDPGWDN